MYRIMVDGQEIYSSALSDDPEQQILTPSLSLEVGTAGSLTFTIPRTHHSYNSINKLKSVVTMEWCGVEIFRGRVLEETVDLYNQKEVYCEGFLSYLLDSVQRPETFTGTTKGYIERAIARHNSQVESKKKFTLGNTPALTDETSQTFESDGYTDTLSAIRAVLEDYEGFLVARYEGGVNYLDYLTDLGDDNGEAIEFGLNLLDFESQVSGEDMCTVLLPIGGMLDDGTTVTIKSVNNDKDTIENAEAIEKYGRIVKTYSFDDVTDPAELLTLAQEKMASMDFTESLTLKAVDMHLFSDKKGMILPGKQVLIHTTPHGIDNQRKVCTALELDPENPEDATYTFGEIATTQSGSAALIASKIEKHTNTIEKIWKHYTETDYKVQIHAGLLDGHDKYISEVFIELDGINETIGSVAGNVTRIDGKVSSIEGSALWLNRNNITGVVGKMSVGADGNVYIQEGSGLKIYKNGAAYGVYDEDNLTAGLLVEKLNGSTTAKIKADRIDLQGYVTMKAFETVAGWADNFAGDIISANSIGTGSIEADEIAFGDLIGSRVQVSDSLTLGGQAVATQTWVKNSGYITNGALAGYATQTWVENKGYVTETALSSKGYATQDWVGKQGYLVSSDYFELQNWVSSRGYATQSWVTGTALTPYATQAWVMANFTPRA